jgi:hypothetical protein
MISFHGKQEIKDFYIARVIKHRELDHLVQGIGYEVNKDKIKGCAVGCTLENYDHTRYPIELGLPEWLALLEDRIFEGLSVEESKLWPERFLSAIPVGVDIEPVKHLTAIKRLDRLITLQNSMLGKNNVDIDNVIKKVINSIETVKSCHEAELNGIPYDWTAARVNAWSAARSSDSAESVTGSAASSAAISAAWAAVWAAEWESAWVAAKSAEWSAACAAESSAASAALSAVWADESAVRSAESAAWVAEANDLIHILENIK